MSNLTNVANRIIDLSEGKVIVPCMIVDDPLSSHDHGFFLEKDGITTQVSASFCGIFYMAEDEPALFLAVSGTEEIIDSCMFGRIGATL